MTDTQTMLDAFIAYANERGISGVTYNALRAAFEHGFQAALASNPAAQVAGAVDASHWLVESTMGCGWWDGRVTKRGIDPRFFSTDPNVAVRFARKEDAERITQGSSFIKATEHIWIDHAQAAPQGQQSAGAGDVPDPCPQCAPGGVCKTPKCGRLVSPELMAKFGIFDAATAKADPAQEADTHKCPRNTPYGPATCGKCFEAELAQEAAEQDDADTSCQLTDAELANPEYVRAYIEGCNESFAAIMAELKIVREQANEVRDAALEEAAQVCENERVEDTGTEGDTAYNMAIRHVTEAIRALKSAPPQHS